MRWRRAAVLALTLFPLLLAGASPLFGASMAGLWSRSVGEAKLGSAGIGHAPLWPASSSAWQPAYGDRFEPGFEAGDGSPRFSGGMRVRANRGPPATTGLLAVVSQVSSMYNLVRGQANRLMNPSAFGFQLHLNVAASLRRPGNGFIITFKF